MLKLVCRIGWLNTSSSIIKPVHFWCQRCGCLLVGYFFGTPASGPWLGKRRCPFPLERFFCGGFDLYDAGTAGFQCVGGSLPFLGFRTGVFHRLSLCHVAGRARFSTRSKPCRCLISASGGLGVWLFPLLMSMISQHWDIQAGFWFYTSLSFLMLVAVFAAGRLPIQVPEES